MRIQDTQYRADFFEERIDQLEGRNDTASAKQLSSLRALQKSET